jgi:YidC/Oxa1 family membrane protein insertase
MPIMFGYIGFTFPSGAVLYWVIGSILSMIQQYVISGWGSLANYLTFLPTDAGLFPPAAPPAAAAAGAGSATVATAEASTERLGFWEVLSPLLEQDSGKALHVESDDATERAIENVRRQAGQVSPRRRRARR